jgi:PKD repeat protein
MKSLQFTLAIILAGFAFSSNAQFTLNLTGNVANAPIGTILYVLLSGNNPADTVMTAASTDINGDFVVSYSVTTSQGEATVSLGCNGMIVDTQNQFWNPGSMDLVFNFTFCDPLPGDCNAIFWAWNDSLPSDSLTLDPFNVFIINQSTGDNLSYVWDFGDGAVSTEAYPNYFYANIGTYTICLTVSNADCQSTSCLTFTVDENGIYSGQGGAQQGFYLNVVADIALAVNENNTTLAGLSIYPNPVSENTVMNYIASHAFTATVEVYNMQGQKVVAQRKAIRNGQNQIPLELNNLTSGNYVLRLMDDKGNSESIHLTR